MAADQGVIDSVSNVNTKTFGDGPSFYAQLAMGDAVAHQRRTHVLAESATAAATKLILTISPEQAAADATISEGSLPGLMTSLISALVSGSVGTKVGQTTPPVYVDPNNGKAA